MLIGAAVVAGLAVVGEGQTAAPGGAAKPSTTTTVASERSPSVLIVGSYERSQSSTRVQEDAVRAEIERAFPFARIRSDYIVSAVTLEEELSEELLASFATTLRLQHERQKFDLIVAVDTIAFRVLSGPGREMIAQTPLIFTGVTTSAAEVQKLGLNATGVYERIDALGSVQLAIALRPQTRKVLVVARGSVFAERLRAEAEGQLAKLMDVSVEWSKATTQQELVAEVLAAGPETVLLYLSFRDGKTGTWEVRGVRTDWARPAFGVFASNLSPSMVGGRVVDSRGQGRKAGEMAVRALSGEDVGTIAACEGCTNAVVVREPMLAKWGMAESLLPAGSRVVERMPGWVERHKSALSWVITASVLQAGVIALLLLHRQRRRIAEAELAASEASYRRIVETAREGIWVADTAWHTTFVNGTMAKMLGYAPEEMLGKHLFEFMDDEARADCERNMQRREAGIAEDHEFRLRCKDGSARWVTISTNAIMDDQGRFSGALAMVTDTTERRRAREEARAAEVMFRSTFEHAAVGMSNVTTDGRWVMMNDRLCQMLGYTREELMMRTFSEVTHPDDVEPNRRLFDSAIAGAGDTYSMEKRYIRKDGSVIWGMVTAAMVRDERGRPAYFISVVQDITPRKLAEAELVESRRVLEQAQKVGRIGSWAWEPREDGRLEWSDEVFRIFGLERSAFSERVEAFQECVHPDDRESVIAAYRDALAGGPAYSVDHRIVRPDGAVRWVHQEAEIEHDADGRPTRMIGVVQDITERADVQHFSDAQRRVLEKIASGAAIEQTAGLVVAMIQEQVSGAMGSVLRLDEEGRVQTVAAPLLPGAYNAAIEGVSIGSGVGSCGAAMVEKHRVVVTDIATDPLWAQYKGVAMEHGLRACWSEPILASDGSVLGSLAMYFKETRGPTARDIGVITTAAHLAGIAMQRARAEEARERTEATNRALLEANPDMMFRMDRAGRYVGYHATDASRLAVPPEKFLGRTVEEVLPPERAAECRTHLRALFATGMPQMYEYQVHRPNGEGGWWEVRMVRGQADEALLLLRDVTNRVLAERRVRESEQRLRLLVESTPLGVVYWDTEFRVTGWNPAAERMFGYSAEEARGKHVTFIVPEASRRYVSDILRGLLSNTGGFRGSNQNVRKDGMLLYCEWYNCPLVDATGKVIGIASVVEDVTENRLTQQRQDFMMAELDHRVKNNLAAVISLAEQTGRGSTGYKEFLDKFMGRVRAMSRMHSVLARSRWKGADLRTLVTQTLEAFGSGAAGKSAVTGESIMIGPRAAQAMAMALNELATNAMKYGALSNATGSVLVDWTVATEKGERQVSVRWEERGGPQVTPPERRGFGSQLIEGTIAYELRGTVRTEYAPSGVVCTMVAPLIEEIGPIEEEPTHVGSE